MEKIFRRERFAEVRERFTDVRVPLSDVRELFSDVRELFSDVRELFSDVRVPLSDVRVPLADVRAPFSDVRRLHADEKSATRAVRLLIAARFFPSRIVRAVHFPDRHTLFALREEMREYAESYPHDVR